MSNSLFSHITDEHYSPPTDFCFDMSCDYEPIIDDPWDAHYNVQ